MMASTKTVPSVQLQKRRSVECGKVRYRGSVRSTWTVYISGVCSCAIACDFWLRPGLELHLTHANIDSRGVSMP